MSLGASLFVLLFGFPSQEDKLAATKGSNHWIMDLGNLEMGARLIFTAAALCDLWSMRTVDNMPISF